jgi:hypothetical protein
MSFFTSARSQVVAVASSCSMARSMAPAPQLQCSSAIGTGPAMRLISLTTSSVNGGLPRIRSGLDLRLHIRKTENDASAAKCRAARSPVLASRFEVCWPAGRMVHRARTEVHFRSGQPCPSTRTEERGTFGVPLVYPVLRTVRRGGTCAKRASITATCRSPK